ncbi:MAG: V-type ATP synthase subunit I, partial [Candidatus Bipolaricaulia bacterium]
AERRKLRDRHSAIEMVKDIVDASPDLLDQVPREGRSIVAMLAEDRGQVAVDEIRNALSEQLGERYQLASQDLSNDRVQVVVSVEPEFAEAVQEYLDAKGFRPISLPAHVEELDFPEAIPQLRRDDQEIPERLEEINRELRELGQEHGPRMLALAWALENRLTQVDASERFGYTDYAFVVSGWIPSDEYDELQSTLQQEFPDIVINEDPSEVGHDEVPVAFVQSDWSRPYQLILNIFGTPKHGTVDPVPVISLFFPILFALVVGDLGYGLIIVGLALWALRGFPGLSNPTLKRLPESDTGRGAMKMLQHGGIFSVIAGVLFGEVFGLEIHGLIHIGPWPFPRVEHAYGASPSPAAWLLPLTLILGAVQVVVGLIYGMVTTLRFADRRHAYAKFGLLLGLIAFTLIIGDLSSQVPFLANMALPGAVVLAIGIPFMAMGGVTTLLEMLSPFIHLLSFARIMGFAVAAVMLAVVINNFVGWLSGTVVILGVILAAIAAVVLHTFNLVLHIFEGAIQSARLQWVEFFEKFLLEELGGIPYQPFDRVGVEVLSEDR